MEPVIVIVGPTAVGKSQLSVKLALTLNGEVINADSMQVYKGLDIGTAKITNREKKGVKHHLFDIVSVEDNYSVYDYQKACREKIEEIRKKGLIPIIVGGTGLYIKAALYDYEFLDEENATKDLSEYTNKELCEKIIKIDPYNEVDPNNRRRLERTLTRLLENKETKLDKDHLLYEAKFIGLTTDREALYKRIDQRVDNMLIDLVDEVKYFYDKNIHCKSLNTGIGYKELYEFFDKKITFKEAVQKIKQNSRNYAKRQYTWFQNQMDIKWFNVNYDDFSQTEEEIIEYINIDKDLK